MQLAVQSTQSGAARACFLQISSSAHPLSRQSSLSKSWANNCLQMIWRTANLKPLWIWRIVCAPRQKATNLPQPKFWKLWTACPATHSSQQTKKSYIIQRTDSIGNWQAVRPPLQRDWPQSGHKRVQCHFSPVRSRRRKNLCNWKEQQKEEDCLFLNSERTNRHLCRILDVL